MTRIALSSGHGLKIRGASGYLDEVDEARRVVERTAEYLRAAGVEVVTFHDDVSDDQNENLNRIVSWHNSQERDYDTSIHFNAYETTSKPMGTECLYVSQGDLADEVSAAIAFAGGFLDRGPKKRTDLFFLNNTDEPAILVEICFVDSKADADLYDENFEEICEALADAIGGEPSDVVPPEIPDLVLPPDPDIPEVSRPTLRNGSSGPDVRLLQTCLNLGPDGDFGPMTENAVVDYQRVKGLEDDGIVGPTTWAVLDEEFGLPPYPYPLPPAFTQEQIEAISLLATDSEIAHYQWDDRGQAPAGYINGMAVAFALCCRKLWAGDPSVAEMAKADTDNEGIDALSWYSEEFRSAGMDNSVFGIDVLRHLFSLQLGLGMRESSGKHCCGRDQSAENTDSMTCEAGAFQMSWNASSSSTAMQALMDQYSTASSVYGHLEVFEEEVSCSSSDWENYGSGIGEQYQDMAKNFPQFSVETCAVGLRNLRQHWGPINRREVELKKAAEEMFLSVQELVASWSVAA